MPTLPTIDVTDDQANAMLSAWGSPEAYLDWLVRNIKGFVLSAEVAKIEAEMDTEKQQRIDALKARLGLG